MKKKIVLVIVLALLVLPAFFVSAQPAQDDDLEKIGCNTLRCQLENLIKILQDRIRELLAENNDNGIWTIGEGSKSLRWTQVDFGSPDNKVDIYLKSTGTNAGVPLLVDLGVPNNGRYSWSKVGRGYQALNVPAGSYLVRVCARNVAQNCRDYDEISVVSSNLGIKLTSPVQNDALARGESQAITWTAGSGVSAIGDMKVNIHMRKVGAAITDQYRFSLAKNEPNDGSFTWTKVGMSSDNRIIPDGKYFITVCVSGSSGFACDSAKVELRTATAPSSNLAAPNISIDQTNDLVKVKFVNGPGRSLRL